MNEWAGDDEGGWVEFWMIFRLFTSLVERRALQQSAGMSQMRGPVSQCCIGTVLGAVWRCCGDSGLYDEDRFCLGFGVGPVSGVAGCDFRLSGCHTFMSPKAVVPRPGPGGTPAQEPGLGNHCFKDSATAEVAECTQTLSKDTGSFR